MITIQLDNVEFAVQDAPTPTGLMRLLVFQDQQSGLRFAVPLDEAGARAVAAQLSGKPAIAIANGMPPIRPAYDGH